jgi:hypothetical protein
MAAVVLMPCCLFADEDSKKVSIVLFVSDDHGCADSGIYGDSHVNTPNIDRLSKESMRFTRAFAASPLCSPSRCVIETGLMPHRNGGHKFGTPIRNNIPTMPELFRMLLQSPFSNFQLDPRLHRHRQRLVWKGREHLQTRKGTDDLFQTTIE